MAIGRRGREVGRYEPIRCQGRTRRRSEERYPSRGEEEEEEEEEGKEEASYDDDDDDESVNLLRSGCLLFLWLPTAHLFIFAELSGHFSTVLISFSDQIR